MGISEDVIWKILAFLLVLAGFFCIEKFLNQKVKGPSGTKWRFIIGIGQMIIALVAFLWANVHSPYRGLSEVARIHGTFKEQAYILLIIGIGFLAIAGIGDIIIGILNSAAAKKTKS